MGLKSTGIGPKLLNDSAGASINAVAKTATFDTAWLSMGGAQRVCFWVDVDAASGTSPTLDIDVECSEDGGTTVYDMPQAANSQTKGSMTQITAAGQHIKWFELPPSHADSNMKVRLECTIGGTNPSFTLRMKYSLWTP